MQDNENARKGITRREALRKGSLAGLGMVWVAPAVISFEMTPQLAQATSGPQTATTQPEGETTTTDGGNPSTSVDTGNTSTSADSQATSTAAGETSTSEQVKSQTTSQATTPGDQGPTVVAEEEVLADSLPFTGLPLEQLLPLAGGAVATGAAVVRASRDGKKSDPQENPEAES